MENEIKEKINQIESNISHFREIDKVSSDINKKINDLELNLDKLVIDKIEELRPKAISVLGDTLVIPTNQWTLGIFGIILVTALAVIIFTTNLPKDKIKVITASAYKFVNNKVETDVSKDVSQILRIITPHESTLSDLKSGELTEEQKKYYKTTTKILKAFGEDLKTLGAQGYTRWEGYGTATSPEKRQWVWNATWTKDKVIDPKLVVEAYKKHFHRSSGIYIEEFRVGNTIHKSSNK